MSSNGGPPDPYGNNQGAHQGQGGYPGHGAHQGQGGYPGHDQSPWTHPAPGATPSTGGGEPHGADPTYLRPGAYGPPGGFAGGGYSAYPPVAAYQNGAGGWAVGLGLASLVLCLVPVLSQLVALAALIAGIVGRKAVSEGRANNGGMALAGIIIGAVVLVLSIALWIGWWGWLGTAVS